MNNTGKLAGLTLFITGASRGIGKAIALKAAADGANIVIAAKTADPHPKLPGTIYTAAKEVEAAGGKCLPCVVDIRNDEAVQSAVENAVKQFGGIDILINNASAISLTGTLSTDMKKYDLMNNVNARGTYLCSQACLTYLSKSPNGHILNISPPLNLNPKWFKNHVAYTMAKYGMSMCALGMSEEFKDQGVAVNCLWPRTAIITAAMEMLGGGGEIAKQCRKPDIMCDAAYAILTRDSKKCTGNFYIDEDVLKEEGVTDLTQYAVDPNTSLLPDFFLDETDPQSIHKQMVDEGAKPLYGASDSSTSNVGGDAVAQTFQKIEAILTPDLVGSTKATYAFEISDTSQTWYLDLLEGAGSVGQSKLEKVSVTMTMNAENFVSMFTGRLKPTAAFMTGKLKIKGDMGKALKLEKLMGQMQSKSKL